MKPDYYTRPAPLLPLALASLAVLFISVPAKAGVTEAWVQRYSNVGKTSSDQAFRVVRDSAGDFFVVGVTADNLAIQGLVLIKYSGADNSIIWQRRYGGPADIMATTYELANHVLAAVDGNGDLVVATRADGSNGDMDSGDFYTAKYSGANGDRLWEVRYTGPGTDAPSAIVLDASGNVVVTGDTQDGMDFPGDWFVHRSDIFTVKYAAADGAALWARSYIGPAQGNDWAKAVAVDGGGNVVVTGSSQNGPDDQFNSYDRDIYTAKYAAADGASLWEKRFNGPANGDDEAQAVTVDVNGNVAVAGYARTVSSLLDFYTVKYAGANGTVLWEKFHDGAAHSVDSVTTMIADSTGNVIVTGFSEGNRTSYDYLTVKYAAADGAVLWQRRYTGPGSDWDLPQSLALDAGGNVVVTGCSSGFGGPYDFYTAKYAAATGALLWENRYNSPANSNDIGKSVVLDVGGNAVVTGFSLNTNSVFGFYTVKYAAANGALLWEWPYHYGPTNLGAVAKAVAVDGAGNVVVTGTIGSADNSGSDLYTAKYSAANGALLWERRCDSAGNDFAIGQAVVVDGGGNVVVTGQSYLPNFYNHYYTARYAATDGALLWEKFTASSVSDLAADSSGNVVVTGSSGAGIYTAKYAAATGTLLWEKSYIGPAGVGGSGRGVAIDSAGNVIVTGSFGQSALDAFSDFYTAKYAAATGALQWEKRYNGPFDSDDIPLKVVLDASDNVIVMGSTSYGPDFAPDCYGVRYAAANGAQLWERYYDLPKNVYARAVATDTAGNLMMTGFSVGSVDYDNYTAKYAAATGEALWEKRSTGPATNYTGRAIALDASGNLVVTGYAFRGLINRNDFYTASYAAVDGVLLWEKSYNGPASGEESVETSRGLALGPDGMVAITGYSDGAFSTYFSGNEFATIVYRPTVPPASFAAWAAGFGLTGGDAAANADIDHDGMQNGVEFVLGGNPVIPAGAGPSDPAVSIVGANVIFTFRRDDASETADVTLKVESGLNLIAWPNVFIVGATTATSSAGVTVSENGSAPDTITVEIPRNDAPAMFARLRVAVTD